MTIAIAATFPWGVLKAANAIPEFARLGGVILMTDSRWSYSDGRRDDMGGKLCRLAPEGGIGAVFAGDVYAAEDGLNRARKRLELASRVDGRTVAIVVSGALREVFAAHQRAAREKKRPEIDILHVLVGMVEKSGRGMVIKLSSPGGFAPQIKNDVQVVGSDIACNRFEEKLAESEAAFQAGTGGVRRLDIREGALCLAAKLFSGVVEPGIDPTVGGPLQIVTVTQGAWVEAQVEHLKDLEAGVSWKRVSVDLDAVKRYMENQGKPPLSVGEAFQPRP